MSGKTKRLMVMAGGTGGHVFPRFGRSSSSDGARLAGALVRHRRQNGSVIGAQERY